MKKNTKRKRRCHICITGGNEYCNLAVMVMLERIGNSGAVHLFPSFRLFPLSIFFFLVCKPLTAKRGEQVFGMFVRDMIFSTGRTGSVYHQLQPWMNVDVFD
jgi:hypothetical protein